VFEPADLAALEEMHETDLELKSGPLAMLFDERQVAAHLSSYTTLDKALKPLLDYRQFDYWIYDEHRNLMQIVGHLSHAADKLSPNVPAHRALLIDCAWLFTRSLAYAIQHVRLVHVTKVESALTEYLLGGQEEMREKRRLANILAKSMNRAPEDSVLPPWFPALYDLVMRHLRRPNSVNAELLYAEWVAEAQTAKEPSTVEQAFAEQFDPFAAKLLADVAGFLVTAAHLDPNFRVFAGKILAQPAPAPPS
jgi:hypothetical protein